MDREKYKKCQELTRRIDSISDSAKILTNAVNEYNQDKDGKAEFVIYTGGEIIRTVLTDGETNKVAAIILETYTENIAKNRGNLNNILKEISSGFTTEAEKMEGREKTD